MKKTFKKLITAFLFMIAISVNASDGLDLKVNNQQNLIVEVQRLEQGAMLSLLDETGEIVYKDKFFNEDTFTKVFDFNRLEDGKYTLIFDKEHSVSYSTITKDGSNLSIDDTAYRLDFKPLYRVSGDQVSICLSNPEENKVEIEIFDKFGVPVGNLRTNDLVVKSKLDFSKVPSGSYIVKIKTKTNTFSKWIEVG